MRSIFCILALIGLLSPAHADNPALARIAIIGDGDNQNLAALLTTELAERSDLTLVERADLAKIGDELKVQTLAGSDAVALGKLINADGLLFIGKGPNGVEVRLTAVGLGYALFDDPVEAGVDPTQTVKSIAHRLIEYAPKLKSSPTQTIPISLLNLRADYPSGDFAAIERNLTLLLESRLSSLPEYVVLERRHAWDLGFEHSVSANAPQLLKGAYVIDGTLTVPAQAGGDMLIHLRVRSPSSQETPLEIHGPADDLPTLVEQMTAAIRKTTGMNAAPAPWQSKAEAREYLEEAIWGSQHNAPDAALEAVDSAELLGETAPDLVAVRITSLCERASQSMPTTLRPPNDSQGGLPPEPLPPGSATLEQRTNDILRAISETARYSNEKMDSNLEIFHPAQEMAVRSRELKSQVAAIASRLIIYLDKAQSPRADDLRQALKTITGYDPLHGKLGDDLLAYPGYLRDVFADQWATTQDEEIAYYRLLFTTPNLYLPISIITEHGDGFCRRFLPKSDDQREAYRQFIDSLKDDSAARLPWLLVRANSPDNTVANEACAAYLNELWNRRESLVTDKGLHAEWINLSLIPGQLLRSHANDAVPLVRYYLTHANIYRPWEGSIKPLWLPEGWSKENADDVWTDYLAYRQRVQQDWEAHGRDDNFLSSNLNRYEKPFLAHFPQDAAQGK